MANPRQENKPQERVAANTGQESRRPSDFASRSAQTVAAAGENATKTGADLFESTARAFEQLWRSAFDMTSHVAERSAKQVARGMGLADEKTEQATEQSSRNIDAIVQSSKTFTDAFHVISQELSSFSRERVDRNLDKMDALMRSRTPQELLAAQSEIFRDNLEGFLQTSKRIAEMSVQVADQATRRLTELGDQKRGAA